MASLDKPYKSAKRLIPIRALVLGLTPNMTYFASIVSLVYGSYLIQKKEWITETYLKLVKRLFLEWRWSVIRWHSRPIIAE